MTALRLGRAGELVRNATLAATTSAGHLGEDPLLFVLQASRRLPAPAVRGLAAALRLPGTSSAGGGAVVRRAFAAWLSGDVRTTGDLVSGAAGRYGRRLGSREGRLLAELAVQVGRADLIAALCPDPPTSLLARAAWLQGDLSGAVAVLGDGTTALGARYRSELDLLRGVATIGGPGAAAARDGAPADAPDAVGDEPDAAPAAPGRASGGTTGGKSGATSGATSGGTSRTVAALHVLTNSLPHTRNGYTLRSHAVLVAQRRAGIRVAAATRIGYPVSVGVVTARHTDVVDGIEYGRVLPPRLPRTVVGRLGTQVELLRPAAEQFHPTVLHTTTDHTNGTVTRALADTLGVPWVYEVRGLLEETWVAGRPTVADQARAAASERYRLLRARETAVAASADHVVTLSRTLAAELAERGLDPRRITVVPNGVDDALLATSGTSAEARAALGLPRDGFWVGTVSSLVAYEGLETLLAAVAELRARRLDVRACIVGDGVARPGLERLAQRLGVRDHTVFTGRVPPARAVVHHRALDVFTVPRRDVRVCRLVTPLKPIEAMACGRPVVASDLPALAEVVAAPGAGDLVTADDVAGWADALARLAEDPARRARLGAAGRAFAAGRTWDAAGRAYRELYERVAA